MQSYLQTVRTGDFDIKVALYDKFSRSLSGEALEGRVSALLLSLGKSLGKKTLKLVKTELGSRYSLLEDWLLPPVAIEMPEFDNGKIAVVPYSDGRSLVLVYAYISTKKEDHCDGCTLAPDSFKGVLPGALFHDIWYENMEAMAKAWGWKVSKVRKIGDQIFSSIILEEGGRKSVAGIYYGFVRALGGIAHWLMKMFCIAAIALAFGGCKAVNVFQYDPGEFEYTSPVWRKENITAQPPKMECGRKFVTAYRNG